MGFLFTITVANNFQRTLQRDIPWYFLSSLFRVIVLASKYPEVSSLLPSTEKELLTKNKVKLID